MDIYVQMAQKIILQQERIIGPIAVEQASKVSGLKLNWDKHEITIGGDGREILDKLITNYEHFFGRASVEVCRDAVKSLIADLPKEKLPKALQ